jgi:SNF2 family DNA or RNA helicase|nr:MAG TPA: Chromatin remodeling complex ATPase [Caudoviricetes sp.]
MIKAKYDKPKKLSCLQSCYLSFDYKPQIVEAIRMIPSRFYNIKDKVWEVPSDSIPLLQQELDEDWEFSGKKLTEKSMLDKTPKFHYDLPKALKTELYNFQREDFNILMNHDKYLLLNEMGTGKGLLGMAVALKRAEVNGIKRCLIITGINTIKWNWFYEIQQHTTSSVNILGYSGKTTISSADKLESLNNLGEEFFTITNVETLRNKEILDKLKKLIRKGEIEMIICDEIHKLSSPSSQQGRGLLSVAKYIKYFIGMTGTLLTNSPKSAYIPLKCVGMEQTSFRQYCARYFVYAGWGGYQVVGYRNLRELQTKIDLVSIRRRKDDVLDLPEKIYKTEYVEMDSEQARLYHNMQKQILSDIDREMFAVDPLGQMIRLRQITNFTKLVSTTVDKSAKFDRLVEILQETDEKVLIFSNWTKTTDILVERLSEYNPAVLTGKIVDREGQINKFTNDGSCKIMVATIGAASVGLTLTVSNTVVFFDLPWNSATFDQAADRVHRISQKKTVSIISLVCRNTIDEFVDKTIKRKRMMGDSLVDKLFSVVDEGVLEFMVTGNGDFYG